MPAAPYSLTLPDRFRLANAATASVTFEGHNSEMKLYDRHTVVQFFTRGIEEETGCTWRTAADIAVEYERRVFESCKSGPSHSFLSFEQRYWIFIGTTFHKIRAPKVLPLGKLAFNTAWKAASPDLQERVLGMPGEIEMNLVVASSQDKGL